MRYRIAIVLGAAALAVVGCSGDDDSPETGPATSDAAPDAAPDDADSGGDPDCSDVDLAGTSVDEFDGCIDEDGVFQAKVSWDCPDGRSASYVKPHGDDGPSYSGLEGDVWHEDTESTNGAFSADCSQVPGYGG